MSSVSSESPKRPTRVLHVVGSMNRGGVETWLMNVLRNVSRDELAFDFMVHKPDAAAYDEELRALGAGRYVCQWPSNPLVYARTFFKILREHGPYDVVHSHVHHFSGFVLMLAKLAGVRIRIAHGHSDTSAAQQKASGPRFAYLKVTEWLIGYAATSGIAVSEKAATSLFGKDWQKDQRWKIIYCGIDLNSFEVVVDSAIIRKDLGISESAFVVGHVGRFDSAKNHSFLIDIFVELKKVMPAAILLLVGDGKLKRDIIERVIADGLSEDVIFTGIRDDVPKIMMGAMNIFVFPSKHEGLGLVLIEAQAAGLTCLTSTDVPPEVKVSSNLHFISLDEGANNWAYMIESYKNLHNKPNGNISYFDIQRSISSTRALYHAE